MAASGKGVRLAGLRVVWLHVHFLILRFLTLIGQMRGRRWENPSWICNNDGANQQRNAPWQTTRRRFEIRQNLRGRLSRIVGTRNMTNSVSARSRPPVFQRAAEVHRWSVLAGRFEARPTKAPLPKPGTMRTLQKKDRRTAPLNHAAIQPLNFQANCLG